MRFMLIFAALLLLALASCGGGGTRTALDRGLSPVVQLAGNKAAQLPPLPPAGHFTPQRVAASAEVAQNGDQATQAMNHSLSAPSITLTAPAGQVAYALYNFAAVPGETVEDFGFDASSLSAGGQVWGAVSNYATGRWEFFAPQGQTSNFTLDPAPDKYVSPGGDIYILVAVFDGVSAVIEKAHLTSGVRHVVTGQVLDNFAVGIPGAVVGTPLGSQMAVTDGSGSYTISLPDGDWPVMVTKDSWTFYSNPQIVHVAGADVSGVQFRGFQHGSNFLPTDAGGFDNTLSAAKLVDLSGGAITSTLSAVDDRADFYRFNVATPGRHYLEFRNPALDIYFPHIQLWTPGGLIIYSSYNAVRGTLRIPLPVADAPRDFLVSATCTGGGGSYELGLGTGALQSLGGTVQDAATQGLDYCLVTATNSVNGDTTEYFTQVTGLGGGFWDDAYRASVMTSVMASSPDATYLPPAFAADLAAGPEPNADFVGTVAAPADSHEPNDSQVGADTNAALTLPYDSTVAGDDLSLAPATDSADYYKVVPALGKGLRVRLTNQPDGVIEQRLFLQLLDSAFTPLLTTTGSAADGIEIRLEQPADGNPVYISVLGGNGVRVFPYDLEAEAYDPRKLNCEVLYNGAAFQGGRVRLRNTSGIDFGSFIPDFAGMTPDVLGKSGETFLAEFYRYGFNTDRHTRSALLQAAPVKLTFDADPALSADQREPNDDLFSVLANPLPLSLSATVHQDDDYFDNYRVTTTTADPLSVDFTQSNTTDTIYCELFDKTGAFLSSAYIDPLGGPRLLATPGADDYILRVYNSGEPLNYSVTIDTAPGYELKGSMQYMGAGTYNGKLYCPELDQSVFTDIVTGNYTFGLVPPGTYTLVPYAAGYAPDQPSKQATVTNATATVNFTLALAGIDQDENNDTKGTAVVVPKDGTVSSLRSINVNNADTDDWYAFTATAGQLVSVTIFWDEAWWPSADLVVEDTAGSTYGFIFGANVKEKNASFIAPASDTYFMHVAAGPVGYKYKVVVTN